MKAEPNLDNSTDIINSLKRENDLLKQEVQKLKSDRNQEHISQQEQSDYEESQIRFRTVFDTSKLGNKIISSDLKILQVNAALVALLGYDQKEEIIGTRILDYVPLEFHAHWSLLQKKLWGEKMP